MKQIFIIIPHSIVDIITNSSTELFVVDSNKTLEFVNEYITERAIQGVGNIFELTEDNFKDFFEDVILYYGVHDIKGVPHIPELYDIECDYRYPYNEHKEFNEAQRTRQSYLVDEAIVEWKTLYYDIIKSHYIGRIVLESADDNSIDGKDCESLEYELNAIRYHLG